MENKATKLIEKLENQLLTETDKTKITNIKNSIKHFKKLEKNPLYGLEDFDKKFGNK